MALPVVLNRNSPALADAPVPTQISGIVGQFEDIHGLPDNTSIGKIVTEGFSWVFNGDMSIWGAGAGAAPTGWTLTGAGASVTRDTTNFKISGGLVNGSASLTRSGANCVISQDIDLLKGFGPVARWQGQTATMGTWVRATVAQRARIALDDGPGSASSSYHSGGGAFEWLTVTKTLNAAATRVHLICAVDTGDTTAQFDGVTLVYGWAIADFIPSGWRGRKGPLAMSTHGTTIAANTTNAFGFQTASSSENAVDAPAPYNGVARNLMVRSNADPTVTNGYVYTLRQAGSNTAVTATITSGTSQAKDITHEVAFTQGQLMNVQLVTAASANVTTHAAIIEYEETP